MMPDVRFPHRVPSSSSGFSLVELMVAMVIGLIIILGAGQLFLTVFQTNRQVELLSEKQAAITFLTEDLIREVRRGEFESVDYRLSRINKNEEPAVIERKDGANFQALVGGLMMPQGASEENILFSNSSYGLATSSGAVTTFDFELESVDGSRDPIKFIAVDRTTAAGGSKGGAESGGGEAGGGAGGAGAGGAGGHNPSTTPNPDNPGYYMDGSKMYSDSCYHKNHGFRPGKGGCEV
ncbi:prepilin-type N-terminal cleavage/methylation domain-containing protein [uncultured Halomonas sp.]|uniref:prepilin-type N-terminal cleavage/methylation domain-containing protein n=1 Tax=uncultured Halomonas sp. TaxID=173971 RepID=UPI002610179A|nr:prepilin-type N-terminal cleavage/methylation domain-containing protein [uncultured Halomonas sp.]